MTTVVVWITDRFEAWHRWLNAPDQVGFLRDWHRHMFHVKVGVPVVGLDREVEFFILKGKLAAVLDDCYRGEWFEKSCEMIATELLDAMRASFVEVSEDGENGAMVTAEQRLPAWHHTGRCFIGFEAEGPWHGRPTLFVPGSVSPQRVEECLKESQVEAIYYGAGNERVLRPDTLKYLEALRRVAIHEVVLEVDDLADLSDQVTWANVVYCGDGTNKGAIPWDFCKWFAGDRIIWEDRRGRRWVTSVKNPLFETDLYVE